MIVAVLEDCPAQRDWVTKLLHDRGHQVVARGDGDSFIALLRSQVVDAALLDWEVPGASGLSVLSWARSNLNRSMPILMLTQRDDEDDVVTALNAGADDYLHAARARAAGARGRAGQAFPPCRCAGAGAAGRPLCVRPAVAQADRARAARQPARARVRAGGIAVPQPRPDPDQGRAVPAHLGHGGPEVRRQPGHVHQQPALALRARATVMWSPRSTTTDTALSAWPDLSGMA